MLIPQFDFKLNAAIFLACLCLSSPIFCQVINLGHAAKIENGFGSSPPLMKQPYDVFVKGNLAYVTSLSGNALVVVDMTLPAVPTEISTLVDGQGGALLNQPQSIFVSGNYAYITTLSVGGSLEIIDISNPLSPVHSGSLSNGNGGAMLGNASGVYVSGNYAYVANSGIGVNGALEIIDITNPASPKHVSSLIDGGGSAPYLSGAFSIFVSGSYAYVGCYYGAGTSSGLEIVDISNPALPVHKGSIQNIPDTPPVFVKSIYSIYVSGNYAYCADWYYGAFEIIDVSNPAAPVHAGSLVDGGGTAPYLSSPVSVKVSGNYAYLVDSYSNALEIVDITNPAAPAHKGSLTNGTGGASLKGPNSVFVSGSYAYVASQGSNAFEIIDISNPAAPFHVNSMADGGGGAQIGVSRSVFISGTHAYIASEDIGSLEVVDIANPQAPFHKGSLIDGGGVSPFLVGSRYVYVVGHYAYVVGTGGYLEIVDVSNPAVPLHVGSLSLSVSAASAVEVKGSYAYVAGQNKFVVVNVTNPAAPTIAATLTSGAGVAPYLAGSRSLKVVGNYAYVVGSNALEVIDITTPTAPVHFGSLLNGGGVAPYIQATRSIFISGSYAYITSLGLNTLEIVDISNPALPVHVGSIADGQGGALMLSPETVVVVGKYAYVALASSYAVEVVDVSNPAAPVHYTSISDGSGGALLKSPDGLAVNSNFAYVTGLGGGLEIIYLYNPAVASFNPTTGAPGTTITLTGINFNQSLSVTFNGVPASTPQSITATSATVTVPVGATVGPISVTVIGQKAIANADFLVIPSTLSANSIQQTHFSANWSDVGAAAYYLDVSTDNFATYVGNYNNLSVGNVTTYDITGLTPNTTYQYRVRSGIGSSSSGSSNTIVVTTIPSTPVTTPATSIIQTGFSANWNSVAGATGYYLDVASDVNFSSILGAYNNLQVTSNSQIVSGLSSGTTYYYRVRSSNASGSSPSSETITIATIPSTPSTQTATQQTTSGFTANWTASSGATNYYLDISTDNFTTFAPGYNNFSVASGNSYAATGLAAGTTYQYRVRAGNASGSSSNSNVTSVLTLTPVPTAQPTSILFSNLTASSVNVSYTLATGSPDGYLVLRSSSAQLSVTPVNGTTYTTGTTLGSSAVAYVGSSLSFFDGGLPTGATYYYSIYSYNGGGAAVIYLTTNPLQGNVTLDVTPPVITAPANPNPTTITNGNTPTLNSVITDNVLVSSAQIFYRGISQSDFKSASMSPSGVGGNYSVQIQTNWYDSLGLEYYFSARDENGNTSAKPSETSYAQLINPSITLPTLPSGGDQKSYRIVAFPYQLATDNKVTTVYNGVPWNDNTKAGMWWWNPGGGKYDQYGSSSTLQTVDVGKGYWMITSVPATPQLTNVAASKYNRANLYTMTLRPGWNEIGNPYPVTISWDDVIALNGKVNPNASFSSLSVFDGNSYVTASGTRLLKAFEGGFVKNLGSSDVSIQIPFAGQTSIGGREGGISSDLSSTTWNVSLNIAQNGFVNRLGGFGMSPLATLGADRYDNYSPPKFLNIPEVTFLKTKDLQELVCKNVIDTREEFTWHFTVAGNAGQDTELSWTPELQPGANQLYLLDEAKMNLIDMTSVSQYNFMMSSTNKFSIYFGKDVQTQISCQKVGVSAPYPNPLSGESKVSFNVGLPDNDTYKVELSVINVQGEYVGTMIRNLQPGYQAVDLAFNGSMPSGIYFYKVVVESKESSQVFTGKIVKP